MGGCCTRLLAQVQQLVASCGTAAALLQECVSVLINIREHTARLAALLTAAAEVAAAEALRAAHVAAAARGMHLAAAGCLAAAAAIGLPYRWRACGGALHRRQRHHGPYLQRLQCLRLYSTARAIAWSAWERCQWLWALASGSGALHGGRGHGGGSVVGGYGSGGWLGAWAAPRAGALGALPCRAAVTGGFALGALLLAAWTASCLALRLRHGRQGRASAASARSGGLDGLGNGYSGRVLAAAAAAFAVAAPATPPPRPLPQPQACDAGKTSMSLAACSMSWPTAMWASSARLLLTHGPVWLAALTAMGGSPATWLLLQLAWHAVLPSAVRVGGLGAAAACVGGGGCVPGTTPVAGPPLGLVARALGGGGELRSDGDGGASRGAQGAKSACGEAPYREAQRILCSCHAGTLAQAHQEQQQQKGAGGRSSPLMRRRTGAPIAECATGSAGSAAAPLPYPAHPLSHARAGAGACAAVPAPPPSCACSPLGGSGLPAFAAVSPMVRTVAACFWLYAAPLLAGAVPVLPAGWLLPQLCRAAAWAAVVSALCAAARSAVSAGLGAAAAGSAGVAAASSHGGSNG